MAIGVGNTAHVEESIILGTTMSVSLNCTGSDRLLVVGVGWNSDDRTTSSDVTGITYNGVALTRAVREQYTLFGSRYASVDIWYLIAPATGSHTLTLTKGIEAQITALGATCFTGVHQTSPIYATAGAGGLGTSTGESLSIASETGQMIYDCMMTSDDGGAVPNDTCEAGQTQLTNYDALSVFELGVSTSYKAASAGSTNMSWSWASSSIAQAMAAIAIKSSAVSVGRSSVIN